MGLGPSGGGGSNNRDIVNIGMTPFYRSLPSRVVWSDIARMAQESGHDVRMHAWPAYQMMSKESIALLLVNLLHNMSTFHLFRCCLFICLCRVPFVEKSLLQISHPILLFVCAV